MPIDVHPNLKGRTPEEVIAQQKKDAAQAKQTHAVAVAPSGVPATSETDNRTPEQRYIDEIAPSMIAGQLVKFSKEGKFVISETEEEISPETDFIALADETLIGWIKFSEDGEPPERHQGLLYGGFQMPPRKSLGDLNEAEWPQGLSGQPTDPWQHQICTVLQEPRTGALYTFVTSSQTGRRAVGNLLRHFDRMQRNHADCYPLVRLKPSGFHHKDERVGWVHTPSFAVVGRAPKNSVAVPNSSMAADLNDQIPF